MEPITVKAPRGKELSCRSWLTEAPLRMLMNNLDPEVAEKPQELIVYGGTGKAARNWESYHKIVESLRKLENDETLLVQSGKPVGVFKTHPDAPRVLIANSLLVPKWAQWDEFRRLEALGLTMYGQMTAGSWIYIGSQGILQGTYETLSAVGKKHYGGTLKGTLTLTAGLGGMGGAQPLAVTMNEGVAIVVEVDPERIKKRLDTAYLDTSTESLDEALRMAEEAKREGRALSIGLLGNASEIFPEFLRRGIIPEIVTDQTSAHDELNGYVPGGMSYAEALRLRKENPEEYIRRSYDSMGRHMKAMVELQKAGAVTFDYGNNIRGQALKNGVTDAFEVKGFVPLYIRPLFCEGKGPFRWAALSGDPQDIYRTDEAVLELFPHDEPLHRWIRMAQKKVHFQGLPSRICWLGYGERNLFGEKINELVAKGEISAPIVIGRDHLDTGSVASPNRETEGMRDGSDAIGDWPILNALLNTASGATWVSVHHGGGVGIGYSLHAGQVTVADGTPEAQRRLHRVLTNDPGIGVARHVDAGYDEAIKTAKEKGMKIPFLGEFPFALTLEKGYIIGEKNRGGRMNKRILALVMAMAFIFVSCGKKKVSNPGIDMNVSFSAPFYNHTLTDVTYQWDLKDKVIPYSPDYKVYVHFWWGAKKIMLAQDDHDLPGDIESWKKGGKFTYTHKNIFIPDFIDEFDPDFSGKEEVTFTVGLYKPGSKESKIPLFQKKLEFTPLPPDYPEITFGEGWYPEEKTGLGIRDSWRWTSQEASAIIENVQKNLRLYLFAGVDKSVYQDQKVIVKLGDKVLEEFVPEFGHFERIYDLKKEDMGDAEEIKLTVGTDKTWIPSKARGGNDNREVGVQVFMLYLKPVE